MLRSATLRSLLALASLLVVACPPTENEKKEKKDTPSAACAKVGQSCEFSPGKLGTCVQRDGCTEQGPACFVCQSQH